MAQGLRALSVPVDETDDGATVHGGKIYGGTVDSHGDHRVAMAFAVAGTVAKWAVRIEDTANVDTSFPGFAACLESMGANISQAGAPA
jgi:3-phosphoshikimate 1-carboxyvinyltransferase